MKKNKIKIFVFTSIFFFVFFNVYIAKAECKWNSNADGSSCSSLNLDEKSDSLCTGTKPSACTTYPGSCQCCCTKNNNTNTDGASTQSNQSSYNDIKRPVLQVDIPTVTFSDKICTGEDKSKTCSIPWLGQYIAGIYKYAIGLITMLAIIVMMFGGIIWILAAGDTGKITLARGMINGSLTGLVIALSTYLILYNINPNLIVFKPLSIGQVEKAVLLDKEAYLEASRSMKLSVAKYCGCVNWKNLNSTTSLKSPTAIANAIKELNPSSPLIASADKIYQLSSKYNIDPGLIIGKSLVENGLATVKAKIISQRKNVGSITCTCGASGTNWVCDASKNSNGYCFRNYNSFDDSLDDYYKVMTKSGGILNNSKTTREMLAKYAPPKDNDTQAYINTVMTVLSKYHTDLAGDSASARSCDCYNF